MIPRMSNAQVVAVLAAGIFFLVGLLSGTWKYLSIRASDDAQAPVYVDLLHRAALLYSFACILIDRFVGISKLPDAVELYAVLALVTFFGAALMTYLVHGLLQDTDNQLRKPHRLGRGTLPSGVITLFMGSLIVAEVGGFVILLYGVADALL
jgi:hypothetical protein